MAAITDGKVISVKIPQRKLSDNKEVICECCVNLEAELKEVKSELSSLREIIRILQEEIHDIRSTTQPIEKKGKRTFDAFPSSEEWITLSSNSRRKLQHTRRIPQQPPLESSNQFTNLTNLNDKEHSRRLTTVTQELSDCRKKRRSSVLSVKKTKNEKHKLTIIGDSHARNCAAELQKT
jgi:chromosome segregation ATPase